MDAAVTAPMGCAGGREKDRPRGRLFLMPAWDGPDGLKNLMAVGIPLILSQTVHAMNFFIDRTFLAWHSKDAFTASLQSGTLAWAVMTLFFMTTTYAGTFVAQHFGAKDHARIGPVVWQSIYLALISGVVLAALSPLGGPIFRAIGHEGNLPELEATYFQYIMAGAFAGVLNGALAGFYTGLGRTTLVLFVSAASCALNVCLNTWLIFSPIWIFPDGIGGAAVATVIASIFGVLIFAALIAANPGNERVYHMLSGWRPDWTLMGRILRFGFPAGVHGVIDMSGFTAFLLVVGYFGYEAQAASNMAMNLNLLLFIPAIGIHAAVQILVGQFRGERNNERAERLTACAALVLIVYMLAVCVIYLGTPDYFLGWFRGGMPEAEWQRLLKLARVLLVFVAAYTTFDALALVYSGALKGAGDTKFVMWVSMIFSQLLLTGPCVVLAVNADSFSNPLHGLYAAWGSCTAYIVFLATVNVLRFHAGRWKSIEVIERPEALGLEKAGLPVIPEAGAGDVGLPPAAG